MKTITTLAMLLTFSLLYSSTTLAQSRTVFVHLFGWSWNDIALECEQYLGPKGYSAVQVSPAQEPENGSEWWRSYQPLSYEINSAFGSREQFREMTRRCKNAGVSIYADVVINHMAARNFVFPKVPYFPEHFHDCLTAIDYSNRWSVQNCNLLGLNDLKTESEYVRNKISDHLNDLLSLGVDGFRIDGAKHIDAQDLFAIKAKLDRNAFFFLEVIGAGNEPIQPDEYVGIGNVTEFNFERTIGHYFKGRGPLRELRNIGIWGGWLNSNQAVVFVSNHDDQREHPFETLTYKDVGNLYNIGEIFMLAYPYGYPKVMSSYYFDSYDQPAPENGVHSGDRCFDGSWVCEHRWRGIANMVAFRNNTVEEWRVTDWWDNGANQIAFGRGGKGFVVINREDNQTLQRSFSSGMAEGEYCDVIHGDFDSATKSCSGPTISVDQRGFATFTVGAIDAAAIHVGAKIETTKPAPGNMSEITFTCERAYTVPGQSVYVIGSIPELGSWKVADAIKLSPTNYPIWAQSIAVPENTNILWKCLKRNETNPNEGIEWMSGDDLKLNSVTQNTALGRF